MTLHPSALRVNQEKSLGAYIKSTLETTEGLTVHYPEQVHFTPAARWVAASYGLLGAVRDYAGRLTATDQVNRVRGFLDFTIIEQVEQRATGFEVANMRDKVVRHFDGASIPIRDYATVGTPIVGHVQCARVTERLIDTGTGSGLTQHSVSFPVTILERRS